VTQPRQRRKVFPGLVVSGVFDAYPDVKILLGHMGERLPFLLWREPTAGRVLFTCPTLSHAKKRREAEPVVPMRDASPELSCHSKVRCPLPLARALPQAI